MTGTTTCGGVEASRYSAVLAAIAVILALFPLAGAAQAQEGNDTEGGTPTDVSVARFAGSNRADTARLIALEAFPNADTVVIASGQQFPDALAGSFLAGAFQAPVLLVTRTVTPGETLAALQELDVRNIIVLGGTGVISQEVRDALETEGRTIVAEYSGASRFETAAGIALTFADDEANGPVGTWEGERTAIVASGEAFPDALVAGTLSSSEGFPILLTPRASLHSSAEFALTELGIERVVIAGGTGAVSADVATAIAALGIHVTRVSGADRWMTALEFAEFAVDQFAYSLDEINIATGFNFADALAVAPRAGGNLNPLILTNGSQDVPVAPVSNFLTANACAITSLVIAGGTAAVSDTHAAALVSAANACTDEPVDPVVFNVALSWENEVNPAAEGPVDSTDPTQFGWGQSGAAGNAELTFTEGEDGLSFELTVNGLTSPPQATAGSPAHIHAGEINENGPVVIVLGSEADYSYDAAADTLTGSGVVNEPEEGIFNAILANPSAYYVNVHSQDFPSGAVRGQLPDGGQARLPEGIVPQPEPADPVVTLEATGGETDIHVTGTATADGEAVISSISYTVLDENGAVFQNREDVDVPITPAAQVRIDFRVETLPAGNYSIVVSVADDAGGVTMVSRGATVTGSPVNPLVSATAQANTQFMTVVYSRAVDCATVQKEDFTFTGPVQTPTNVTCQGDTNDTLVFEFPGTPFTNESGTVTVLEDAVNSAEGVPQDTSSVEYTTQA